MSDISLFPPPASPSGVSGLSFDSTLLSPVLFFCLILLLFLSYLLFFSACWPFLLNFFQKILQYFSLIDRLFLYDSCLAARRSKLVGSMCSMLPYGTDICFYAFIYFCLFVCFLFVAFVYSFFTFFRSGIDKSIEWSTIPACPSLMCFFNRGYTEGTNSSTKKLFDVCVCFLYICVRTDFLFLDNLWFDDLHAK